MQHRIRSADNCPHRISATPDESGEVASCGLIQQILEIDDPQFLRVIRDACEACCESFEPTKQDLNPIIASLVFSASEQIVASGGVEGCTPEQAQELNQWAEKSLPVVAPDEDDSIDLGRHAQWDASHVSVEQIANLLPMPVSANRGGVKKWAVGITTAPRRLPTLEQCVHSVLAAGWDEPMLLIDGDVEILPSMSGLRASRHSPAAGALPNYILALWELYLRHPAADAYLMIQDDALMLGSSATRQYLESFLWPDDGACIASLYCSTKYVQETAGWHKFDKSWVWGAVAFVFSRDALKAFISSPIVFDHRELPDDQGLIEIDVLIGKVAVALDIPIYYPSPSLVQHIGTISTLWDTARAVNGRRASQFLGDLIARS